MSKKQIRAQLRKANNNHANGRHDDTYDSYILPATAEAYEQMVEQMWYAQGFLDHNEVKQQLRAIGITPPKKGRT